MQILKSVVIFLIALAIINPAHSELSVLQSTKVNKQYSPSSENNQAPKLDPESRFASLAQMYEQGELVSIDEIQGWHSGRCFSVEAQNKATNALMAKTVVKTGNDEGPAFPSPELNYIIVGVHFDSEYKALPAHYFDHYDGNADSENFNSIINTAISSGNTSSVKSVDIQEPIQWSLDVEKNGRLDVLYKVKKNGEYIVIQGTNLIKNNSLYSEALGKVIKHDIGPVNYCYFFKKIRD